MELPQEHKRLMELIGLVRDGGLDDSQTSELERILENDPDALTYYVESIDVTTMLYRQQGIVDVEQESAQSPSVIPASVTRPSQRRWPVAYWSAALAASLAVGVLLGGKLFQANDPSPTHSPDTAQVVHRHSEIATLSVAAGCRWDSDEAPRYEGQRLKAETLHLKEGVAVVQFDSDVRLVLEGPSHLELASVDRAMLRHGKVVFSGEGDLDRFTLETPFSNFQDEGTEYAVSVDRSGKVGEVHVFDGRVICAPSPEASSSDNAVVHIDAGDARRISGTGSVETIELASNQFVREPVTQSEPVDSLLVAETFEYDTKTDTRTLEGLDGGTGWQMPWKQVQLSRLTPGATLGIDDSFGWPGRSKPAGGCMTVTGDASLGRVLQNPIYMNQDAAYYLSFLVRTQAMPQDAQSGGWAYFTLRNLDDKAGKISLSPISHRGTPRIVHDGRVANVAGALRENTVYLFVCKILARQSTDDQVTLRIYADHETVDSVEPSIWSVTARPVRNDSVLNEFRLSARNAKPIQFDKLRIGKTWASVMAPYTQ